MRNCFTDPTAIANVDWERRREEKRRMPLLQKEYEKYLWELEREAWQPRKAEEKTQK